MGIIQVGLLRRSPVKASVVIMADTSVVLHNNDITTCIKCYKEFYGIAGLHGYKLCNECAIRIGELAEGQKKYLESLATTKGA